MKRIIMLIFVVLLLQWAACDDDTNYYDYYEYSYIDTVLAADTIQNNELVNIVHIYPGGCNHFERIESAEHGDTLDLAVLYHFYFRGMPCAHGTGLDTTLYVLQFSVAGAHYLSYDRSEEIEIVQPVYVEE